MKERQKTTVKSILDHIKKECDTEIGISYAITNIINAESGSDSFTMIQLTELHKNHFASQQRMSVLKKLIDYIECA
jgi:hypothetical protein